jgi:alkanesulfonate monooxygenase SsuD/methylene tetrahydromethanopterin reductase-like flavin-dependent oxidoreductase (luciferase family)
MKFGLTLPTRGVLMGITTLEQMLRMAETAERSGQFSDVWVGDSLLGKPRMESITLMAGIAARTRRSRRPRPRPPIWIANNAVGPRERIERTHRRVARHADGWQTAVFEPDDVRWRLWDVREKAREIGRNPDELETSL